MVDIQKEACRYNDKGDDFFNSHEIDKSKMNYIRYSKLNYKDDLTSGFTYCNWAGCLYYQKNYPKAIRKYQSALVFNPRLYHAYNGWGSSLSNMGRFDEAIEKFNLALEIYSSYTLTQLNIVLALLLKKNNEEALIYFEEIRRAYYFMSDRSTMVIRYKREIEMLEKRLEETKDEKEIVLIQERIKGVERLLDLLDQAVERIDEDGNMLLVS